VVQIGWIVARPSETKRASINWNPDFPRDVDAAFASRLNMAFVDWIGFAAAFCTTTAYIPQVLRVWRTRSTKDISLRTFMVLVTGLGLWLAYGIGKGEIPIMLANGITICLASTILFFKLRQG
jgi:MtN3 and saliva related transmembrane protein